MREYNELALTVARAWQSEQTGFVHHCYHAELDEKHDSIPCYENFLFVLALLRSRLIENIQEAKVLLNRLLSYQKEGNFPVYLHDYPETFDWTFGKKLLIVLKEINLFSSVIGQDLKVRLHQTIQAIGEPISVEFSYESKALGNYLLHYSHHHSIQSKGEKTLFDYRLLQEALKCWDTNLQTYIGPAVCERTDGLHAERSVFDLICCHHQGLPPPFEATPKRYQLEGVLIKPIEELPFEDDEIFEGKVKSDHFSVVRHPSYTYTLLSHKEPFRDKRFHPFRLFWGKPSTLCSLVCQNGYEDVLSYQFNGDTIELIFDLPEKADFDNNNESQEIAFYCTRGDRTNITIENQKATIFRLRDTVNIYSRVNQIKNPTNQNGDKSVQRIDLKFELMKGEGEFIGHLMPGNRPSQKLKNEAYDWHIFLRTLHRHYPCQIKVTIKCYS